LGISTSTGNAFEKGRLLKMQSCFNYYPTKLHLLQDNAALLAIICTPYYNTDINKNHLQEESL